MMRMLLLLFTTQVLISIMALLTMRLLFVPVAWQALITLVGAVSCITGGPSIVMMLRGNGGTGLVLNEIAHSVKCYDGQWSCSDFSHRGPS